MEVGLRSHVVGEVPPHVGHRQKVVVVVQQELDFALAAEKALDQPRRRYDLGGEIGPAEIEILVAVGLGAQAERLGQERLYLARVLNEALQQRLAGQQQESFPRI